jgi:hypothetical protein
MFALKAAAPGSSFSRLLRQYKLTGALLPFIFPHKELHAPFTHIGWILNKQGRELHVLWLVNQVRLECTPSR